MIVLNGDSGITTPTYGGADTSEYLVPVTGFKNRIINGAMVIAQRGTSSISVSTDPSPRNYPVDRFFCSASGGGVYSTQQSSTSTAGFANSIINTVTTADSSIAAGDVYYMAQAIEGYNMADFNWGSVNAATVTLSFWVRSSVTGTFSGSIRNSAANRAYVFTYTISAANTWEQKSVTITGDTSGTWDSTTSAGAYIAWDLGSGTNFNGTASSWTAGNYLRASTAVNWIATSGATFYITGVQLEKGSTATSFDYRPYGTELALCQRYYETYISDNAGEAFFSWPFTTQFRFNWQMKVTKRAAATFGLQGLGQWSNSTPTVNGGTTSIGFYTTSGSGYYLNANGNAGVACAYASAEL